MRLLVVVLVLLASWGLLAAAGLSLGEADARELATGPAGAVLSVALLVVDVLVPVPSTVVMVAQGAAFGALGGAALAWLGLVGAAGAAYGAGRLAARRGRSRDTRAGAAPRASLAAIAISRPVPILAEALMAVAGADRVPVRAALGAAAAGALPVALVFATLGAAAGGPVETALVAGATLALTALLWAARRRGAAPVSRG